MTKSAIIKFSSAAVLLLYIFSFVGLSIHTCSRTGHVCVSLAVCQNHGHETKAHSCHCHDCKEAKAAKAQSHSADCCHHQLLRISVSGETDMHNPQHIELPSFDLAPLHLADAAPLCTAPYAEGLSFRSPPVHQRDIIHLVCTMRV